MTPELFQDPEIALAETEKIDARAGLNPNTSHYSVLMNNTLPYPQRMEAAKNRRGITDAAFAEFPPTKEFRAAFDELRAIQHEFRAHLEEIQTLRAGLVGGQYKAMLANAAKAPVSEPEVFAAIEPESAFTARLEAEIRARTEAIYELGRRSVKSTLAIQREINRTLGLFVAKLEKDEIAQAKKLGVAYEAAGTARLAHSVRLLFCYQTWDWRRLAKDAEKKGPDSPFPWTKNILSEYIDTFDW